MSILTKLATGARVGEKTAKALGVDRGTLNHVKHWVKDIFDVDLGQLRQLSNRSPVGITDFLDWSLVNSFPMRREVNP